MVKLTGWFVSAVAMLLSVATLRANEVHVVQQGTQQDAYFAGDFHGSIGYVVGARGSVLRTDDSGLSWEPVGQDETALALMDVSLVADRIMAVGQLGTVLVRSERNGWRLTQVDSGMRLLAVHQNKRDEAAIVGQFGTVLVSRDAGNTWQEVSPDWAEYNDLGLEPNLYDVFLDDEGIMTVVGEFGYVLRSADLGESWQLLHEGEETLNALALNDRGVGLAVGQSGLVLKSEDDGTTWERAASPTQEILLGVTFLEGGKNALITGIRTMLISRDEGSSWSSIDSADIRSEWYQDVVATGSGAPPVAVGHSGRIIQILP